MVFFVLCLLPESAVLRMVVPRMPVQGVLVYQVPVPGTVVPGMTVQMVLLPKCLFIRWLAQGWWLQWCLLVSFTSGCLGDDPCDCCPTGGSLWSSFLTGVSSHTGVFFPLECHLVPFLVFSKQNKTKLPVNIVAIETTWTKIIKWQTLLLYHWFQNDSDNN